jgi:hypothetical protein
MKWHLIFITIIFVGCHPSNNQVANTPASSNNYTVKTETTSENNSIDYSLSPVAIIYKTKNDYYDKVPVTLNDNKTKIISYPGPKDIFYNEKLSLPEKLSDGFLLDNRGINKNVAFLNITYSEYSTLTEAPLLSEMMKMIIDKDPLTEMYNCGSRYQYKDIVADLNKFIDNKKLSKFKRIY